MLKAKVMLKVSTDVQLVLVTLAALATVIDLEAAPLTDETVSVRRNLAFFEGVPYPQMWHDFISATATLFPPTLKH